ncbi:MAG: hypothetical protein JWO31_285, partial [Phycisphaerales bacterium]|nr:hypothetical protein [Phycisphaerales bacterium]
AVRIDGVCFRRPDGNPEPVVRQGEWLEVFVRARAMAGAAGTGTPTADGAPTELNALPTIAAAACNLGLAVYDRHDRLLFARGWVNAGLPPVDLSAGGWVVGRFAVKLDLEPGEYVVGLSAAQAVPDPAAPHGWDQHVGGDRYHELPRAAKVAVIPAPSRARVSFGPANLRSRADGVVG